MSLKLFHETDVTFENKVAGVTLSGTLTLPQAHGRFPAVILIAGMGPNDRNATFGELKPFEVLAHHLASQGIAVLRYDKRGVGKSTGVFDMTLTSNDFAQDVLAAIEFLKNCDHIDPRKIGLIGHSEGGMIATIVAANSPDVAFVVLFGGVVQTGVGAMIEQTALQLKADEASNAMMHADAKFRKEFLTAIIEENGGSNTDQRLLKMLDEYWNNLSANLKTESEQLAFAFSKTKSEPRIKMFNSPWYRFFLNHNPELDLQKIHVPLLGAYGEFDFVTSYELCAPVIVRAMNTAHNDDYEVIKIPGLNHQFQKCKIGSIAEYGALTESIAPEALSVVSDWIVQKTE